MIATDIVKRAQALADISNTDFLTHWELTHYLNESWNYVCQQLVNHNIDLYTARAQLVGANGRYKLPFDFWQMKSVCNPYSGRQILRKTTSFPKCSSGYNIVNDYIEIDGINPGPIVVTYYRKPFYISIPNKTLENIDVPNIIDTAENNILYNDNDNLYVWTSQGIIPTNIIYQENTEYYLIRDEYVCRVFYKPQEEEQMDNIKTVQVLDFNGILIYESTNIPDLFIKSDDGLVYFGYIKEETCDIYKLDKLVSQQPIPVDKATYVCIANNFYQVPVGSFPIGMFDDRPAYVENQNLCLITGDDGYSESTAIVEPLDLPIIKVDGQVKYGIISNNKIYSNIPNTDLNFPNNLFFEMMAARLAVYFLCKQNASSEGVESMYTAMEKQFFDSLDASAGYQRLVNVR